MKTGNRIGLYAQKAILQTKAANYIGALADRAKVDRKGIFWPLGDLHRQGDPSSLRLSLGYGTPGVLLALLEYYENTGDKEVSELIQKAVSWLQNEARAVRFQHGFYTGDAGRWYVYREIDRVLPGLLQEWKDAARNSLSTQLPPEAQASMLWGIAGTIVGAQSSLMLSLEEETQFLLPLLEQLVAVTKLSTNGVYWDFSATSLYPPLGFCCGNAGVDYCLAHLRRRLNISYSPLLCGSLERSTQLYEPSWGNWPDFEAMPQCEALRQADIESLIDQESDQPSTLLSGPIDSIAWGTGLTGILVSRSALAIAYKGNRVGHKALADCKLALRRFASVGQTQMESLDSSINGGVAGILLGLRAYLLRNADESLDICQSVVDAASRILMKRSLTIEKEDLSLLTGVSGTAYTFLKVCSNEASTVVDPLVDDCFEQTDKPIHEGMLEPFIKRCLPISVDSFKIQSAIQNSVVNLQTISAALACETSSNVSTSNASAIKHELGLHKALSETNFRRLFCRESANRRNFDRLYTEGMDENLLFSQFIIDESATLLQLDFDPRPNTLFVEGNKLLFLRQATSRGILESEITSFQFHILSEFERGAFAIDAINNVVQRVDLSIRSRPNLTRLALNMIRTFARLGYLKCKSPGLLERLTKRSRLISLKMRLFPEHAPDSCSSGSR